MKLQIIEATKGIPKGLIFEINEAIGSGSSINTNIRGSTYHFDIDSMKFNPDGTLTVSNSNAIATLQVIEND